MTHPGGGRSVGDGTGSLNEMPLWVPAGRESLFGVLTAPPAAPRGLAVILVFPHYAGGASGGSLERNDSNVTLAHELATAGFHVFRYDMRGSGDSTGAPHELRLNRLHTDDVLAVVEELRRRGLTRVILLGKCFGGRTIAGTIRRIPGLHGAAFISMTLAAPNADSANLGRIAAAPDARTLLSLFDRRRCRAALRTLAAWLRDTPRWIAWPFASLHPVVLSHLRAVLRARVPVLFLYGTRDEDYPGFACAAAGQLAALLARAGDLAAVRILDGDVHGLTTLAIQRQAIACLRDWVEHVASRAGAAPESRLPDRPLETAATP
jgi:pimeloyl-ACP methyl ester carboxylesterase